MNTIQSPDSSDERKFQFKIGETYELQDGSSVKIVGRYDRYPGYETVVDGEGIHRYDRSTYSEDAGRVTGTPFDFSHPKNIKKKLA